MRSIVQMLTVLFCSGSVLVLSACQPLMLDAPASSAQAAEAQAPPAQPGGPPTPFPAANQDEELWRQQTIEGLFSAFVFADSPQAASPVEASGTFGPAGPPSDWVRRDVGDICLISVTLPFAFTGTVSGSAPATKIQTYLKGPCNVGGPGKFNETLLATGTFEGNVNGNDGTFDFIFAASVESDGNAPGSLDGRVAILRGTGSLASLSGTLITEEQPHGPELSMHEYTGLLFFDEDAANE